MSEVMWLREDGGIEHVVVSRDAEVRVDGVVVWPDDGGAEHRLRYTLRCDASWRVREVHAEAPEDGTSLHLYADGDGEWRDGDPHGAVLPHLQGCIDVDLYAVAFTNTLPVRRLTMAVGAAHLIDVAYVQLPSMRVETMQQRYTRVSDNLYRYESVVSGFTADLLVDAEGLVITYPGLVRRMWAR